MNLSHIHLAFEDKVIFHDFSLTLNPGQSVCITGISGRGKSTLLNLMLGFVKPDSGTVTGFDKLKKGVVFQEDRLIEHMNAVENVLLTAPGDVTGAQVASAFARVLLYADKTPVSKLSGGQRRRVAVVRAVMARPQLLLMDEPFKGLDPETLKRTAAFIREETPGATIVLSAHDLAEAALLGIDRIISL